MTDDSLDLEIVRFVAAPPEKVWRAWSDPDILKEWWCPKPWTTEVVGFDFRAGGAFHMLMRGPDGASSDNPGAFLDVTPMQRIVWTSMLTAGWRPASPWMGLTGMFLIAPEKGGVRYTARALHKDRADRDAHEERGFFHGWAIMIDQIEAVAKAL